MYKRKNRFLVFSSAGDNNNVDSWLDGLPQFDLWITYYGDGQNSLPSKSTYYRERKGAKFPNLLHAYVNEGETIRSYDAVFVLDDDIVIGTAGINRLFELLVERDLFVLQPAFDPRGKISHGITMARPWNTLRYTNFVEVTCPLFQTNQLCSFLEMYDPSVIGWGVDWWFLHLLKNVTGDKIAIVDEVLCLNPHDNSKASGSEIDKVQSLQTRKLAWEQKKYSEKLHIDQKKFRTYASIKKTGLEYITGLLLGLIMHPIRLFTWLTTKLKRISRRLQFSK